MTQNLVVGSIVARRGEKVSGFIEVAGIAYESTRIPVTIVGGASDGPVLALIAGIHGSEPSPIIALQRVRAQLDPAQLSGTVVIVHIANLPSFQDRTIYRGPWDQKNLNRVFPGNPNGTASERIAYAITTEVIDHSQCVIDMHSGDGNESLRPYAYWNKLGLDESVDAYAREIALAFGLDHIIIDRGRPRDPNASVFCSNTAHVRGKPAITTEAGGVGVPTEEMVELNVRGAFRVMRHLRMIPGDPERVSNPIWLEPSEVVTSPATGLWYPAVATDQRVEKGQLLGRLTDYFGESIAEVHSPLSGVILYIVVSPAMAQGEPIGMVGTPSSG